MEEIRNAYKIFVGKPLWNSPLGRTRLVGMIFFNALSNY
jgi:hypothetical protein